MTYSTRQTIALLITFTLFVLLSCREKEKKSSSEILQKTGKVTKITKIDNIQFAWEIMKLDKYYEMLTIMDIPFDVVQPKSDKSYYGLLLTLIDLQTGALISNAEVVLSCTQGNKAIISSHKLEEISGGGMHHYGATLPVFKMNDFKITAKVFLDGMDYTSEVMF